MAKNKKVLFLSPYPFGKASSQRLKYEQYFSYFEENGYDLTTSSFVNDSFWSIIYSKGNILKKIYYTILGYFKRFLDLFRLRKYDIVYIHLWATPLGLPIFEFLICLIAKKIVYDIDDLIFIGNGNTKMNRFQRIVKGKTKSLFLIKHSNHVITCTPYLNDFAKTLNRNCTDISSTIDTDRFTPISTYSTNKLITIGWTGTHSTMPYLLMMTPMLKKLKEKRTFKLVVIADFFYEIEGIDTEFIKWSSKTEIEDLQKINIGIYPLPTSEWVMGKSGLKALQYMAIGIPAVATNIGTIHRIIEHEKTGFLATTEDDWINQLTKLIDNPSLRENIGKAGREVVEKKYSIKSNQDTYLTILNNLL